MYTFFFSCAAMAKAIAMLLVAAFPLVAWLVGA